MSEGVYTFQISRVNLKKNIHTYLICTKKQNKNKTQTFHYFHFSRADPENGGKHANHQTEISSLKPRRGS